MSIPDGAQLSDDGQWWWDGAAWQPAQTGGNGTAAAASAIAAAARESGFTMGQTFVIVDDDDNPDHHETLHHDAGIVVSFDVLDDAGVGGEAAVSVFVDNLLMGSWFGEVSGAIESGSVRVGRLAAGNYAIRVLVRPTPYEVDGEYDLDIEVG
jgi:hypothetical protein